MIVSTEWTTNVVGLSKSMLTCCVYVFSGVVVKVYLLGPRNSLKMWAPCFFWSPNATQQPRVELASIQAASCSLCWNSQSTHTVAYVHCKQCENCNIAARNRLSNGTDYMLYMFGATERAFRFNFTYLAAHECQWDKFASHGMAFRCILAYFNHCCSDHSCCFQANT